MKTLDDISITDTAAIVARGQQAWATIKATNHVRRAEWYTLGLALRVGRLQSVSESAFHRWCDSHDFRDLPRKMRLTAESWAEYKLKPPKHGAVPVEMREWYRERIMGRPATPKPRRNLTVPVKPQSVDQARLAAVLLESADALQRSADLMREASRLLQVRPRE
ncbi:hypothetical protein [Caballeronia sp. LZ019]|uniref:hypothetical protein n=1 Tax=Caballeronia sp. LZ019 TaxID=3038555 RepID=UPI0028676F56|nr:hypothetical protein [Caballeronia sp. LZ019]MDR5811515.1 hypothetical protein [Caballeronia sp. LZ019]